MYARRKYCFACNSPAVVPDEDFCEECLNDEGLQLLLAEPGLTHREYTRSLSMIKGRVAETLIEEMFLRLGYAVYRCGMENTFPEVMKYLARDEGRVAWHIRKMPDLAVRAPHSDQLLFVEVKFRSSGTFDVSELGEAYPYDDAYIIVVSRRHIKCLTARELKAGDVIEPQSTNYLGSRKEFAGHRDVIIDFCRFATMFFANA